MLVYIAIGAFVILLSITFRVAAVFRLSVPLLYALIAPTLFFDWFQANYELASLIGYLLFGLAALSWVVSLIRKILQFRADRIEEKLIEQFLVRRTRESCEMDENGYRIVTVEGLYR